MIMVSGIVIFLSGIIYTCLLKLRTWEYSVSCMLTLKKLIGDVILMPCLCNSACIKVCGMEGQTFESSSLFDGVIGLRIPISLFSIVIDWCSLISLSTRVLFCKYMHTVLLDILEAKLTFFGPTNWPIFIM